MIQTQPAVCRSTLAHVLCSGFYMSWQEEKKSSQCFTHDAAHESRAFTKVLLQSKCKYNAFKSSKPATFWRSKTNYLREWFMYFDNAPLSYEDETVTWSADVTKPTSCTVVDCESNIYLLSTKMVWRLDYKDALTVSLYCLSHKTIILIETNNSFIYCAAGLVLITLWHQSVVET